MKVLFITPHLSTGGLPSYLLWKVKNLLKKKNDVIVLEWQCISLDFVVQRNTIQELLSNKFITCHSDINVVIQQIKLHNPDVIHFEELPESFLKVSDLDVLKNNIDCKVAITTHDSNRFNSNLSSIISPDYWVMPMSLYEKKYINDIPVLTWEIPARIIDKFVVLNVGLFCPNKNQAAIFEIARRVKQINGVPIEYRFAGNLADNFTEYWKPLLNNKPDNVKILGELNKKEIEAEYKNANLLLHTSLSELNPIVIKEALAHGVPVCMPKYPILGDKYKYYPGVTFLDDIEWTTIAESIIKESKLPDFSYNNIKANFNVHFVDGCTLTIQGGSGQYKVEFWDVKNNLLLYDTFIGSDSWAKCEYKYYIDWEVRVYQNNIEVFKYRQDLTDKKVLICIESSSLGDTIAWMPYVEEFQKKHNCKVALSTFCNELFNTDIELVAPGIVVHNIYALYRIGWFYKNNAIDTHKHLINPQNQSLHKTAADILGIENKGSLKPNIKLANNNLKTKRVVICRESTAKAKLWNRENGWQEVVDDLIRLGYEVVEFYKKTPLKQLNGCAQYKTPDYEELVRQLNSSVLLIGLGSGMTWLAWAMNIPVILISGFSKPYTEMVGNDVFRIHNDSVCNGCFNTEILDKSDWNWCPYNKGTPKEFECSKSIDSKQIIMIYNDFLIPLNGLNSNNYASIHKKTPY